MYVYMYICVVQDQLKDRVRVATYDGDTGMAIREEVRNTANIVLTNPDMLHASILPSHDYWCLSCDNFLCVVCIMFCIYISLIRFLYMTYRPQLFKNLKYVVVDEAHMYRGVFGVHVALVFRRLVCNMAS